MSRYYYCSRKVLGYPIEFLNISFIKIIDFWRLCLTSTSMIVKKIDLNFRTHLVIDTIFSNFISHVLSTFGKKLGLKRHFTSVVLEAHTSSYQFTTTQALYNFKKSKLLFYSFISWIYHYIFIYRMSLLLSPIISN